MTRSPDKPPLTVADLDPALLAREANGAIQIDLPLAKPRMAVIGGPIKVWWGEGMWDTLQAVEYRQWRDAVRVAFKRAGFLVYCPHLALEGAWWEPAQQINDKAIQIASVFLNLTPPGVRADGTDAECVVAARAGTPIFALPPGSADDLAAAIEELRTWPVEPHRGPRWIRTARHILRAPA